MDENLILEIVDLIIDNLCKIGKIRELSLSKIDKLSNEEDHILDGLFKELFEYKEISSRYSEKWFRFELSFAIIRSLRSIFDVTDLFSDKKQTYLLEIGHEKTLELKNRLKNVVIPPLLSSYSFSEQDYQKHLQNSIAVISTKSLEYLFHICDFFVRFNQICTINKIKPTKLQELGENEWYNNFPSLVDVEEKPFEQQNCNLYTAKNFNLENFYYKLQNMFRTELFKNRKELISKIDEYDSYLYDLYDKIHSKRFFPTINYLLGIIKDLLPTSTHFELVCDTYEFLYLFRDKSSEINADWFSEWFLQDIKDNIKEAVHYFQNNFDSFLEFIYKIDKNSDLLNTIEIYLLTDTVSDHQGIIGGEVIHAFLKIHYSIKTQESLHKILAIGVDDPDIELQYINIKPENLVEYLLNFLFYGIIKIKNTSYSITTFDLVHSFKEDFYDIFELKIGDPEKKLHLVDSKFKEISTSAFNHSDKVITIGLERLCERYYPFVSTTIIDTIITIDTIKMDRTESKITIKFVENFDPTGLYIHLQFYSPITKKYVVIPNGSELFDQKITSFSIPDELFIEPSVTLELFINNKIVKEWEIRLKPKYTEVFPKYNENTLESYKDLILEKQKLNRIRTELFLEQFETNEERYIALKIIENIKIIDYKELASENNLLKIKNTINLFQEKYRNLELNNQSKPPVMGVIAEDKVIKSGDVMLYLYKKASPYEKFSSYPSIANCSLIVFLEDVLGSGKQLQKFIKSQVKELLTNKKEDIHFLVIAIYGYEKAIENTKNLMKELNLKNETINDKMFGKRITFDLQVLTELPDQCRVTNSGFIFEEGQIPHVMELLEKYSTNKDLSLGYDKCASIVVNTDRCSNNVPTLFWQKDIREGRKWIPIFRRFE